MNSNLRRAIIVGTVVALVVIICALALKMRQMKQQDIQAMQSVQLTNTILTKHRNKLSQEVAEYKASQFTIQQLSAINDSNVQALRKSVSYWKGLVSHTAIFLSTSDTLKMAVHDTVYKTGDSTEHARVFSWNDEWLILHGLVTAKSAKVSYSLMNKLTVDYFWKRDHWWTKQYLAGSVTQANPNTVTDKVVQFTVIRPTTKWYEKWWLHFLLGAGAGGTVIYLITK